jgi:hypothetical protein
MVTGLLFPPVMSDHDDSYIPSSDADSIDIQGFSQRDETREEVEQLFHEQLATNDRIRERRQKRESEHTKGSPYPRPSALSAGRTNKECVSKFLLAFTNDSTDISSPERLSTLKLIRSNGFGANVVGRIFCTVRYYGPAVIILTDLYVKPQEMKPTSISFVYSWVM